jgi:GH25 family lysozyme M1 (1,4-beta-N-acetylmuramidase)
VNRRLRTYDMNDYIPGVDRSHLNDPYPLSKLVAKGIKWCAFKATQGITYVDPVFNQSWQEAKATPGLYRMAYHFFDPRYDGIEQCKNFLAQGINFKGVGCIGGCIDVEDLVGSSPEDTQQANQWVADNWQLALSRLQDFLNYFKEQTGLECIIYSYNNYMREYYHSAPFPNNPMWLSSLQENCPVRYDTGKLPEFWQNTYNWNDSDMDGDFFTCTQVELDALSNIAA